MREHGTRVKYVIDKCRCDPCRRAATAAQRERRNDIEPAYVTAGPAREHVRMLSEAGVGLKTIAKASGVANGTLSKLMFGDYGRKTPPSKRIRKTTLDKILAVTPTAAANGSNVDAGPSWVLLDEMIAAGVPKARIAEQIGQRGPALQLSHTLMSARNVRAVADLHARWKAGTVTLAKHHRGGTSVVAVAPVAVRRPSADISDLLLDLAEIVEERNEQPWRAEAACRNRPSYLWFPARGDRETLDRAIRICRACMVRDECRAANLDKREGVYGGLTVNARSDLRKADAA